MKQSEVNLLCREAAIRFEKHEWALPPKPQFAATDFGLGDYKKAGLVEVLLATILLHPGERITLTPGIWHEFAPAADYCLIGEVSTWCDEAHDNFFADPAIDIFQAIDPDEAASLPVDL